MFEKSRIPSTELNVELELVVARPQRQAPFPTIVFNHGSTGRGVNKSLYSRTWCPPAVAKYFNERGWLVAFPQRRGRGKSGGTYAEGLAADGSGYSCDAAIAMAGFERAVEDLDAVMNHLRARPDIDHGRLMVGGVSRGGILSIAYAGMRPNAFKGAINFNGGWLGRACPAYEIVNPALFARGASAGVSTLWMHGSFDQYYRIGHCRRNFEVFERSGGRGTFVAAPAGHALLFKPALWTRHLDRYIGSVQ